MHACSSPEVLVSENKGTPVSHPFIPSGKLTQLWKITMFNGKIHYTCLFSIVLCYQWPKGRWIFHDIDYPAIMSFW